MLPETGEQGAATERVELLRRVAAAQVNLTPAEAKVAALVLAEPSWVLGQSLMQVAIRAGVSEPTVIRFCRSIGLDGFQSFRLRLAQSIASGALFLPTEVSPDDDAIGIAGKVLERSARTLLDLRTQLHPARMEEAVALLAGARRLEFYGLGSSGIVAADARHKFFRLGVVATAYADAHLHGMAATMLGPADVVVAISSTGRTIDLISSVELALEAGARVIAITAPSSPLARLASVPIEISVDEDTDIYTPMTTRLAQLAIIDALSVGVAMRQGPELIEKLERTWRSLRTKRVPGFD
jgi:RpiR family transcriptional regulator, carbohydrate utilization regulator